MADPTIADTRPMVTELQPGEYWWCACGRSKNQPYCDGSHQGTEFSPVRFQIDEVKRVALCQCKRTGKAPLCDGTHSSL